MKWTDLNSSCWEWKRKDTINRPTENAAFENIRQLSKAFYNDPDFRGRNLEDLRLSYLEKIVIQKERELKQVGYNHQQIIKIISVSHCRSQKSIQKALNRANKIFIINEYF